MLSTSTLSKEIIVYQLCEINKQIQEYVTIMITENKIILNEMKSFLLFENDASNSILIFQ